LLGGAVGQQGARSLAPQVSLNAAAEMKPTLDAPGGGDKNSFAPWASFALHSSCGFATSETGL